MREINYYSLLAVSRSASGTSIKASYRKLSLQYHPDSGGTTEQMILLNQAYDVLSNPLRRREYDEKHPLKAPRPDTYTSTTTNDFVFVRKPTHASRSTNRTEAKTERGESMWQDAPRPKKKLKTNKYFWSWFGVSTVALAFFVYQLLALFQPPASRVTTGIATAPTATTSPAPTTNVEVPDVTTPDIASSTTDLSTTSSTANTVNTPPKHHYFNR